MDIIDGNTMKDIDCIPGDIESKLYQEHEKDILFEIICGLDRFKEIITDKMRQALNEERLYSTGEISNILDINRSTISTWVKALMDYIDPEVDGRTYKLNYKSLFKIRMICMLREDNQYTINKIKALTLGTDVIDTLDIEEEKEKDLNIRVKELEETVLRMEEESVLYKKLAHVFLNAVDKDILLELQNSEDISLVANKLKKRLIPPPQVTKDEIESIVQQSEDNIYKNIEKKIEDNNLNIKKEMAKEWASATEEQLNELRKQFSPRKGLFQRLFGK